MLYCIMCIRCGCTCYFRSIYVTPHCSYKILVYVLVKKYICYTAPYLWDVGVFWLVHKHLFRTMCEDIKLSVTFSGVVLCCSRVIQAWCLQKCEWWSKVRCDAYTGKVCTRYYTGKVWCLHGPCLSYVLMGVLFFSMCCAYWHIYTSVD